jgi:hypothetical protein
VLENNTSPQKKKTIPVAFSKNSPRVVLVESEKRSNTATGVWWKVAEVQ